MFKVVRSINGDMDRTFKFGSIDAALQYAMAEYRFFVDFNTVENISIDIFDYSDDKPKCVFTSGYWNE